MRASRVGPSISGQEWGCCRMFLGAFVLLCWQLFFLVRVTPPCCPKERIAYACMHILYRHECAQIHTHAHTHVCIPAYVHIQAGAHTPTHAHTRTRTHLHKHMCAYSTHILIYIHVCIHACVHIHASAHMPTDAHIHIQHKHVGEGQLS